MMLILLAAALIGDLILLPAILASPLGRFFGKTQPKPKVDATQDGQSIRIVHDYEDPEEDSASQSQSVDEDFPDVHPESLKHLKPPPSQDGSAG